MKRFHYFSVMLTLFIVASINAQGWAKDVLASSITFHDPHGKWPTFEGQFKVTMRSPERSDRESLITISLPKDRFELTEKRDGVFQKYSYAAGRCESVDPVLCERAEKMKNYYTYLYGLPMKLNDPGTILDPKVERVVFDQKETLRLKVTYDPEVGSDTWYFYLDPQNYQLLAYQFYHNEALGDGEYILLSEIEEVGGIKMPKSRKWFYNADKAYLGEDILTSDTDF